MRNFKSIALLATLVLSNVAFAVSDSATLTLVNSAPDTISADNADLTWAGAGATAATGTGTLNWATAGVSTGTRKVTATVSNVPTFVKSLTIKVGTATTGVILDTTAPSGDILSGLAAQTSASPTLSYTAELSDAALKNGFAANATITVDFTISE
ncbi:hypothetical protein LAJ19_10815 [Deinococcus taeanensis]|uniref:hypothetical protein n=1 Tax=Deinococcus taeanensis TaxID=2737050 RepID=UPI001CDC38E6|nr:hypothetical protein [Deinococcus taeanensis]UBV42120.1 hypothetical protein LAJ19_10815 [Deinococcus taeanensis]